jgi:glycosyltransferase involved in cell wall biosynthesis
VSDFVEGLVSTIIPVHNRAGMLREAVDSVLAQTWRPIEVIIADDGSTDDTIEVGRALAAAHPGVVRYAWRANGGAGVAREHGRNLARGEFIQYLDSDDTLWPRKFELQIAALRANPDCGAAYGHIRLCPQGGPPAQVPHKWSGRGLTELFPALLVDRWWNTDAPLWRRIICDRIGAWTDLRYSQDWEYDARAGALGVKLAYCAEFVCDQRHHQDLRQTGSGRWLEPADRLRFFRSLHASALSAGVKANSPEMRHFARWVFFHSRDSAAKGAKGPAIELARLARQAMPGWGLEVRAFVLAGTLLGWRRAAEWTEAARRLLRRVPGAHTLKQSWSS